MTHHDGDDIVPDGELQLRVLQGRVTRITRYERVVEEGDTFEVQGSTYEVRDVTERTADDIGMGDYRQEHATNENRFWGRLQQFDGPFEVEEDTTLYTFQFAPVTNVDIGE